GIIFSLEYYSERKLLLSTSDDRTVAAWQFFENAEGQEEVTLLRRFYGHDARVWRALAIHGYLLSVGESSDVRVNILKDGTEHKSWRAHDGAPIFDCVYDQDVEILYTGGNDGSIRKWPKWWYRLKPRILPFDVIPFDTENDSKSRIQGSGRWSENKDYPKSATLLDLNHVIVSMESGRVVGMTWQGKQFDLLYDERCEGYSIIKISPDLKVLAVAGNNGHFYTAQISFSVLIFRKFQKMNQQNALFYTQRKYS
ncbi:WD repeat-containing protein 6, partial [Orchesella cincta]